MEGEGINNGESGCRHPRGPSKDPPSLLKRGLEGLDLRNNMILHTHTQCGNLIAKIYVEEFSLRHSGISGV